MHNSQLQHQHTFFLQSKSVLAAAMKAIQMFPDSLIIVPNLVGRQLADELSKWAHQLILVDVEKESGQMDLNLLDEFLGNFTYLNDQNLLILKKNGMRIAGILAFHFQGIIQDMDRLQFIAKRFSIPIVEDCTQARGTYYKRTHAGNFGKLALYNVIKGEKTNPAAGQYLIANSKLWIKRMEQVLDGDQIISANANEFIIPIDDVLIEKKEAIDAFYFEALKGLPNISFINGGAYSNALHSEFIICHPKRSSMLNILQANNINAKPIGKSLKNREVFKHCMYVNRADVSKKIAQIGFSIPANIDIQREEQVDIVGLIQQAIK